MGARAGKRVAVLSLHFLAAGAIATASEFKPGWIYVSATSNKGFVSGDLIWAFNPANGQSELLGDVGQAGTSDLLFTPDGSRLLNAMFSLDAIGAVRPDGGYDPYLDSDDGISNPWAMTYDRPGNLFVIGTSGQVLRFPAGGGPGEVFADQADGIGGRGPLATSPQGDLYYAGFESTKIIKVTPDGVGSVFATLDQGIVSMCTDTAGNLFVQGVDDLFKIDLGDSNSLHVLNDLGGGQFTNIRMSPDESALYRVSANSVRTIDPVTGEWLQLGLIPVTPDHYHGTGMAVYVPEPAPAMSLLTMLFWLGQRRASIRIASAQAGPS